MFSFRHKKERYRKTINILCYHILCKYSCMLKIHFLHFYISFMLEIYKFTGMLFNIIKSLQYHIRFFSKFDIILSKFNLEVLRADELYLHLWNFIDYISLYPFLKNMYFMDSKYQLHYNVWLFVWQVRCDKLTSQKISFGGNWNVKHIVEINCNQLWYDQFVLQYYLQSDLSHIM